MLLVGLNPSVCLDLSETNLNPGTPTLEEFYGITSRRSRDYIRALPIRKRRPFSVLFPKASPEALDFLAKTLVSHIIA